MKIVRAKINWLTVKNTSGQPKMSKTPYRPIIIFNGQYKAGWFNSNEPVFSAEIFNEKIDKKTSIASLTLAAPKAPFELMQIGSEFELYEVTNKVAMGKIIEEIN